MNLLTKLLRRLPTAFLKAANPSPEDWLVAIDIGGNATSAEYRPLKTYKQKCDNPPKSRIEISLASAIEPDTELIPENIQEQFIEELKQIQNQINQLISQGHRVYIKAIGTAPFRDAKNGAEFAKRIHQETGIPLEIITGEEEARLAAEAVLLFYPDFSGVVMDMGGGSVELARIEHGKIIDLISLPLGTSKMIAAKGNQKEFIWQQLSGEPREDIDTTVTISDAQKTKLQKIFATNGPLIPVGGTFKSIIKDYVAQGFKGEFKTNGKGKGEKFWESSHQIPASELIDHIRTLQSLTTEALEEKDEKLLKRSSNFEVARKLLEGIIERFDITDISLTKTRLRDGIRAALIKQKRLQPKLLKQSNDRPKPET